MCASSIPINYLSHSSPHTAVIGTRFHTSISHIFFTYQFHTHINTRGVQHPLQALSRLIQTLAFLGGANIPALNDALAPFGVSFGDTILEGQMHVGPEKVFFGSGVELVRFPKGGRVVSAHLNNRTHDGL